MKKYVHLWKYFSKFFLVTEIFRPKFAEKIRNINSM